MVQTPADGVAVFEFDDLCRRPLGALHPLPLSAPPAAQHTRPPRRVWKGDSDTHKLTRCGESDAACPRSGAADYLALAQRFHTVVIREVPQMSTNSADAARRRVYMCACACICVCECEYLYFRYLFLSVSRHVQTMYTPCTHHVHTMHTPVQTMHTLPLSLALNHAHSHAQVHHAGRRALQRALRAAGHRRSGAGCAVCRERGVTAGS